MTAVLPQRRRVRRGVLGACCVGAALLLAACGASHTPGASVPRDRTFIDAVPALPGDLDSSGTPTPAALTVIPSWSSELVRPRGAAPGEDATLPPADDVVPYLATSWRLSRGGDITFLLRHGVRGATGDPFTASDVAWSIRRDLAVSPVAPYLFSLANLDTADPVTLLGPYSVRINVTAPSPFLLAVLASDNAAIYDRRLYLEHAKAGDPWAEQWGSTNSASFGAYYVAQFTAAKRIILLANPYAWDHPYYKRVEIKQMPDPYHRLRGLLSGAVDHSSDIDWKDYTDSLLYGSHSHVTTTILQAGPATETLFLNLRAGPLRTRAVREAIGLAVDRADLAGRLYAGYAKPDVLALPAIYGQSQPAGYDLARARRLLAAAGYPHGLTLPVYLSADLGDGSEELHVLALQLALAGITLQPTIVYNDDQLLELEHAQRLPATIEDIDPVLGGAAFLLIQDYDAALDRASPAFVDGYSDPALTRLLAQLRHTAAGPAADRLTARAAALVERDAPAVNLFELPVQNVTRSGIAGYAAYAVPVTYYEYLHPAR